MTADERRDEPMRVREIVDFGVAARVEDGAATIKSDALTMNAMPSDANVSMFTPFSASPMASSSRSAAWSRTSDECR